MEAKEESESSGSEDDEDESDEEDESSAPVVGKLDIEFSQPDEQVYSCLYFSG